MLVRDILKGKPAEIHQIIETAPLSAASRLMSSLRVGALVVHDGSERRSGLISEREVTGAMARWGGDAPQHLVREVMIREPLMARPTDTLTDLIAMMTHQRARHVPIVEGGALVGILSIGDLLQSRPGEKIQENLILQDMARMHRVTWQVGAKFRSERYLRSVQMPRA